MNGKTLPFQRRQKIIHVDMDCFFAAIVMRDDPSLRHVPLAIGSRSKRGVLSTCNYEARKYGLSSAMPTAQALKLCPHLVLQGVSGEKIREASEAIHSIFQQYTHLVQPLSCDEAFLDVTHHKDPIAVAKEIRQKIYRETKLTASAGVAPNKFLAKVASEWNKPNGLCVIPPSIVIDFVEQLPVGRIPGVGKVSEKKLKEMGLHTCGDIQQLQKKELEYFFGKYGRRLYEISHGIDNREVETEFIRKSLSVESTFRHDLTGLNQCLDILPDLQQEMLKRFTHFKNKKNPTAPIIKGFIKVKFHDFQTVTVEKIKDESFFQSIWDRGLLTPALESYFKSLLKEAYQRGEKPVRLVGIGLRFRDFEAAGQEKQLVLF